MYQRKPLGNHLGKKTIVKPSIKLTKENTDVSKDRIIGYKGFDKNLMCRDHKFEVGVTYTKTIQKQNPVLCTSDGYHYCEILKNVYDHYQPYKNSRYCEIEILGYVTSDKTKSITTSFKILKELSKEEIEEHAKADKHKLLIKSLGLLTVRKLQEKYPLIQISGSIALYLHGVKLKRLERLENNTDNDLDLIVPYYHHIGNPDDEYFSIKESDEERSGSDYDECIYIDGKKADIRVDPKCKYEMIMFEGFNYRVTRIEHIMEAKVRYMLNGQIKHREDCYEIFGKK